MNPQDYCLVPQSMNYKIVKLLKNSSGKWMTPAEIARTLGSVNSRSVGKKLSYLIELVPGIEMRADKYNHNKAYRYAGEKL